MLQELLTFAGHGSHAALCSKFVPKGMQPGDLFRDFVASV